MLGRRNETVKIRTTQNNDYSLRANCFRLEGCVTVDCKDKVLEAETRGWSGVVHGKREYHRGVLCHVGA